MLNSGRIGVRFASGDVKYYDIDPDGRVYWLQPRSATGLLQRWRVRDEELAAFIRDNAPSSSSATIAS